MRVIAPEMLVYRRPLPFDTDWWDGSIREITQHDIYVNELLVRYDAIGRDALGTPIQKTVIARMYPGEDMNRVRGPSIAVLKDSLNADGLRPQPGFLKIPHGVHSGRFL
jgi:hypothetical protein